MIKFKCYLIMGALIFLLILPFEGWTATIYNFTTIDFPGASNSWAGGINNSNDIVGARRQSWLS